MKQVRDSFLYTCGYILGLIAQWGLTVIIVQLTGLDDSGYFALAMSICSVFFFVASYGMRSYQISDIDGQFSDATYISSRVFTTLAGFALCALYSVSSGYSWHQIQIILLYMLFRCCEALYDVLHGIWQQHNNLYNVGLSLVIKAVVNFLAFLIPYYLSRNLEIGLACMIASAIVLLTADAYFTGRYVTLVDMRHVQSGDVIHLLKVTFVMMLFILCSPAISAIPRIILEKMHGRIMLSIYSNISSPTVLISSFASCFFLPLIPKFTAAYHHKDSRSILRYLLGSCMFMALVGGLAILVAKWLGYIVVSFVYGSETAAHSYLLTYVIISVSLSSIIMCLNNFLTAIRKLKSELFFSILGLILCIVLSFLLIGNYALIGTAYAMCISQGIQVLCEFVYIGVLIRKMKARQQSL